ncbi:MAG TPA: (2Fe-2S)-binding protein [Chloroflexota bacterium]
MAQKALQLKVNGQNVAAEVEPAKLLLDFLRDDLGLTGTKEGCGTGDCGACTVHMDGKAVHSCLTLALEANGAEVTTVEGLAPADGLHPIQAAIVEYGGTQCGFCIPGFVMMASAFLKEHPHPSEDELRMGIAGNLCRCTGYDKIVRALQAVSEGKELALTKPGALTEIPLPPEPEGE